ncbi:MAG: carboxypeptidase regulatory-like domain-containing protein, partial [Anaerolineales bacterium]|nr:carboxypeptidase regulatory-like domain-containing protein [Anaerolineales bacterium]
PFIDGGTAATPQGLPFIIEGSGGGTGPWASATPNSGTVPVGDSVTFEVVFDATGVTQEGTFTADLTFSGNFENSVPTMPLTMNITCPTCGILDGSVTDADSGDPVNATVALEGNGVSTSVTGSTYAFAVPAGTYTLTVTANGYLGDTAVVTANTGETTTTDFTLRLNAPDISADPTSLHATLMLGDSTTQTLTIQNDGAAGTDFTIREIEVMGAMNMALADIVADGSFEADPTTGPWTEVDTTNCIPWIGDWFSIVGVSAHDGAQYYWAGGGCNSAANSNSAAQTIAIPSGMAELTFWYHAQRNDPDDPTDNGQAYIQLDGSDVWTLVTNQANNTTDWTEVTVDVSAYAGQTVELKVGLDQGASGFANVFFDALSIEAAADVPWLATDPVTGTVAANSMTDVAVLFDTTVLTQTGSFSAILELASDDANSPLAVPVYLTVTAPMPEIALDVTVSTVNECGTADTLYVAAGTVVYYCYTVENMGNMMLPNHVITDTVFGHVDTFVYDLYPGMVESVVYSQTVMTSADSTAMWEASHDGFGMSAMATDTVMVMVVTPGVEVNTAVDALSALAGETVTYTVHITNTGDLTDTFDISLSGQTWDTTAPVSITLAAGEHATFDVTVMIPTDAMADDNDSVLVTAKSQTDDTIMGGTTLTTTATEAPVTEFNLYLPLITRP